MTVKKNNNNKPKLQKKNKFAMQEFVAEILYRSIFFAQTGFSNDKKCLEITP